MTTTRQQELEIRSGRPVKCVSRNGANEKLGTVSHELERILARPLNHKVRLTGVMDIASKGAAHAELRFVVPCLEEFLAGRTVKRSDDQIAVLLFGELQKQQRFVRVKRIYRALNCKHDHFYNLTRGRNPEIRLVEGCTKRTGPGGSGVVRWEEIVRFIGERRQA